MSEPVHSSTYTLRYLYDMILGGSKEPFRAPLFPTLPPISELVMAERVGHVQRCHGGAAVCTALGNTLNR